MLYTRVPLEKPEVKRQVDGLLLCDNGRLHWLSWWEDVLYRLRLINPEELSAKHFPLNHAHRQGTDFPTSLEKTS